jgi:hypothetical protein
MNRRSLWPLFALACAALVASCRDATAPRVHPMSGAYTFTTVLDSISYEASGPLGCGSYAMYCTLWRADGGGRLTGTFVVSDDVAFDRSLGSTVYGHVWGQATGLFAGQAVTLTVNGGFLAGPLTMSDTTRSVVVQLTTAAREGIRLSGTFAGDSIVGTVHWSEIVARSPPTYKGTFVAHRRW